MSKIDKITKVQGEAKPLPESADKKKKKKKKDIEDYDIFEEAPAEIKDEKAKKTAQLDDISAIQEFVECNKVSKRLKRVSRIWLLLVLACFIFVGGSYLIFNYGTLTWWDVTDKTHEHTYDFEHPTLDNIGDCQHKGYYEYVCTYPGCGQRTIKEKGTLGPHIYQDNPSRVTRDEEEFDMYVCSICGEPNYVPIKTN